jgi:FkbM family methyltransferase
VGVHSYFLARWSRHVYSYEPNPELAAFLMRSVPRNVTVSTLALSNWTGTATLTVPLIRGLAADPYGTIAERQPDSTNVAYATRCYPVSAAPLDAQDLPDVGFIKIDVEGHEFQVIEGARETIRRHHPVLLVEIEQRRSTGDIRDLFSLLEAFGYRGQFLLGSTLRPLAEFSIQHHQIEPLADPHAGPYVENFMFAAG